MGDLMMQSKTNECSTIVLQTEQTRHHKYLRQKEDSDNEENDDEDLKGKDEEDEDEDGTIPFPHLTEYYPQGVRRPSVAMMRAIQNVRPRCSSSSAKEEPLVGGDFADGIILAADALHQRTKKLKFERSIVLWTDARGYNVVMDVQQMLQVIDSLRAMECRLYVVGMDFTTPTVDYLVPAEAPSSSKTELEDEDDEDIEGNSKRRKLSKVKEEDDGDQEEDEEEGSEGDEGDGEGDEDEDENPDRLVYKTPKDREKLLRSLTEKTGGTVLAAHTMQEILQRQHGERLPSVAVAYKVDCQLAPNLVLQDVRYCLWASPKAVKSFLQEAVQIDEEANDDNDTAPATSTAATTNNNEAETVVIRKNALGEEMTEEVTKITSFVYPEDPHTVIPLTETTKALRYGSDLIPMNEFDLEGLKAADSTIPRFPKPTIQVLGYLPVAQVPQVYRQGPPYRIFSLDGRESRNSVALLALSRALARLDKVAIVTFNKKRDGEPVLGGLFPNKNKLESEDYPLVFLQLPFAGDVKELPTHFFDTEPPRREDQDDKVEVARNLIRSLSLPESMSCPLLPQNPFIKAWNQTLLARALDPNAEPVSQYTAHDMQTPPNVLKDAAPNLQAFRSAFPIKPRLDKADNKAKKGLGKKNNVLTYRDFLKE
ncbi:hypothetical protein ACA910_006675 [Epithemia clementina (nom. ined.)]